MTTPIPASCAGEARNRSRCSCPRTPARAQHVQHGGNGQPRAAQPRSGLPLWHKRLHDRDRNADAPYRMQREDRLGELDAHPQRRQVRVAMQIVVARIGVVPQQLVDRPLLDQRIRRRQQHHRRPAAAAAAELTDQQGAEAVQRRQHQHQPKLADGEVAQEKLTDERRQQEQSERGAEPSQPRHDRNLGIDHPAAHRPKVSARPTKVDSRPGRGGMDRLTATRRNTLAVDP
jgi:hypothetical protein